MVSSPAHAAARPHTAVVVVHWNAPDETRRCLISLQQVAYRPMTICLVDNGSTDGSGTALAREFPAIDVVTLPDNRGYAGGCNAGIRRARELGAKYVLVLNNDTILDAGCLEALVSHAEAMDGPAILAPKILRLDRPDRIWSAGSRLDRRAPPGLHIGQDEDEWLHATPRQVDWATGCALFFPASVIDRIGLMEERFFLYLEDTDWCLQARAHGVPVWYVPDARLWHEVSASTTTLVQGAVQYYATRNRYLLAMRNARALGRRRIGVALEAAWWFSKSRARLFLFPSYRRDRSYRARADGLADAVRNRFGRNQRWTRRASPVYAAEAKGAPPA
jgi:GT2 family glycosyltransferase